MKAIKRSFGLSLSVLLLLSFSVVLLPLDFLHNHGKITATSGTEKVNSSSSHKLNIQNKPDYCWVCAVHFDKSFTQPTFFEKVRLSPVVSVLLNNETTGYFIEQLFSTLRGPPSE